MRPKSLLLLALALGCGLIASIGISQVMDHKGPSKGYETEQVYVAKHDINVNEEITEEALVLEDWPVDKVHVDAIRELDKIVGRRPATKIFKGDQLHEAKLVAEGAAPIPTMTIPKGTGMRVIQIKVDAVSGGAGLLRPGDHVDLQLFLKANPQQGIAETQTLTLLKDIQVFAVEQQLTQRQEDADGAPVPRTVGLLVTEHQSRKVNLASKIGSLTLVMRHPDDVADANNSKDIEPTTIEEILTEAGVGDRKRSHGQETEDTGKPSFADQMVGIIKSFKDSAAVEDTKSDGYTDIIEGGEIRRVEFYKGNAQLPHSYPINQGTGWSAPSLPFVGSPAQSEPSSQEETESVGAGFFGE